MKRSTLLRQKRINLLGGNPFKGLREELGYTLEVMAAKTSLSKQALIRCEQGTYAQPLPALLDYYVNNFGADRYEFSREYEDFQKRTRASNFKLFGDELPSLVDYEVYSGNQIQHPFRQLRGSINPTEVAKALCIPQATITYFEQKPRRQKSVPKVINNVLEEIGYSRTQVQAFNDAYVLYRECIR